MSLASLVTLIAMLGFTSTASAESIPVAENVRPAICSKVEDMNNKITMRLGDKQKDFQKRRQDNLNNIKDKVQAKNSQLAILRLQWDKNRMSHYEKLIEKSTTQEQKAAIEEFKSIVESAVTKRRDLFDKATQDYQSTIDYAMNNRQNGLEEVSNSYKSDITRSKEQLEKDCQQDKSESDIRNSFNNSIQQAKRNLESNVAGVDQLALQINQARQNRTKALEQAMSEFRATIESAKEELRVALSQ